MKKLLTSLLCVMMVVCFMPAMAWADAGEETNTDSQNPAAVIGTTSYDTLQAAVNEGGEVTLLRDVQEAITVPEGVTVTLDLGDYKIEATGAHAITNNGTLTIKGTGTVDAKTHAKGALVNTATGTVTIEGGTFTRSEEASTSATDNGGNSWYVIDNHGSMTITGGEITNTSKYSSLLRNVDETAVLYVQGGTFKNDFITLKNDDNGTMYISGEANITSDEQALQNWSYAEISGGTFSGPVFTWAYTDEEDGSSSIGKTVITGGTIQGNVWTVNYGELTSDEGPAVTISEDATIVGSIAIARANVDADKVKSEIEISGGNITGDINNYTSGAIEIEGSANIVGDVTNGGVGTTTISENAVIDGNVSNSGSGTIDISNGTISGTVSNSSVEGTLSVTGGTFATANVDEFIPADSDVVYVKYIRGTETIVVEKGSAAPAHSEGNNTWKWDAEQNAYVESYVYIPILPTTPTVQKPVIEPNADVTTSLSTDGTALTIKANDGYEITDVTVNGVSKGAVTTLTGLKTGDKIVITTKKIETPDDNTALIEAVKNTKLIVRSAMSTAKGKKAVKVSWYAADGSDLEFDGYEVFRSLKRYSGFGTTPIFKTSNEKYYNTAIKKGNKYYYKVRAYKVIDGEKVYTDWSTKAWRTVK